MDRIEVLAAQFEAIASETQRPRKAPAHILRRIVNDGSRYRARLTTSNEAVQALAEEFAWIVVRAQAGLVARTKPRRAEALRDIKERATAVARMLEQGRIAQVAECQGDSRDGGGSSPSSPIWPV